MTYMSEHNRNTGEIIKLRRNYYTEKGFEQIKLASRRKTNKGGNIGNGSNSMMGTMLVL